MWAHGPELDVVQGRPPIARCHTQRRIMMRRSERTEAIRLRRDGTTYHDIMQRYGMAKSTLWRWLKEERLVDAQSQQYTERRLVAQRKATETVRRNRLEKTQGIISRSKQDIGSLTARELRLIGTALYWAEGAKQKERKGQVSEQVVFANTDPRMLHLFVTFLRVCCGVLLSELRYRIYLHETAGAADAREYWHDQLGIDEIKKAPITWKRHKPKVSRANVGRDYHGLLRIRVCRSTDLNRRIMGWIDGIWAAGEWCNGNTGAFGASIPGSNPGSPAFAESATVNGSSGEDA